MKARTTITILLIIVLIAGCLPWQPPQEQPLPTTLKQKKEADHPSLKEAIKTSGQPFLPSRLPTEETFPILVTATITHPATILGKEGFSPAELTIDAGDSVTWLNADQREKVLVLTFQKINTREFITSLSIPPGQEWDHVFTQSGEYTYWTTGYGVKGKLVVKESSS